MSNDLLSYLNPWDATRINATISSRSEELLDALLLNNRTKMEDLAPPFRRAYQYLVGLNEPNCEASRPFVQGRLATLLDLLRLAIARTEPVSWNAHFRDNTDLKILQHISGEWRRVKDIATAVGLHDTTITRRLQTLAREELVVAEPVGREVYYRLHSVARESLRKRGLLVSAPPRPLSISPEIARMYKNRAERSSDPEVELTVSEALESRVEVSG